MAMNITLDRIAAGPADHAAAGVDARGDDSASGKRPLIGLSRAELAEALGDLGIPPAQRRMRASQLWGWLYGRGATDFAAMTNIAKDLRARLEGACDLARPEIVTEQ